MRAVGAGMIAVMLLLMPIGVQAEGSEMYRIDSFEQLTAFSALVAQGEGAFKGKVCLTNDIEASGLFVPIGDEKHMFSGTFDGQGHAIMGLETADGGDFAGLFGFIGREGVVRNLRLEDVLISGRRYAGAVAGYSAGRIENCVVSGGRVIGKSDCEYGAATGGIVGLTDGQVNKCVNLEGEIYGKRYVGGVAGSLCSGSIERSVSMGCVTSAEVGEGLIGGIAGAVQSGGKVRNCISISDVRAERASGVGGIAGGVFSGGLIKCISLGEICGRELGAVAGYASKRAQIAACFYEGTGLPGVGEGRQDGTLMWKRKIGRWRIEPLLHLTGE